MKNKTKKISGNKKPAKAAKKKIPSSKKSLLPRKKKIKNPDNAKRRKKDKELRKTKERLLHRTKIIASKISDRVPVKPETMSAEKIRKTFHELQVHQLELEMQNEEMHRMQSELDATRARYFDLYDMAPVGYCTVNGKGLILEANLTAATLLGVARGKLVKQSLTRFILKEDQDTYYLHRNKLFDTGETQTCDMRMVKKDGSVFWAHLVEAAVMDDYGSMVCRVIISDITERKQAEEKLYIEQQRFRILAEQSSDIILLLNQEGIIIYENPAVEKILGFKIKERIGRNAFENIHPDDKNRVKEAFDTFTGNKNIHPRHNEVNLRDINGNMHTFESISRHLIEDNISEGIIVNLHDITERKNAEILLQQSEKDYRSLFEQSLDGIIIIYQSRIVAANQAFCLISGLPLEKAIGANPLDFIHPEDRKIAEQRIGEMLSGQEFSEVYFYRAFRADGSLSWIELRSKLIQWEGKPAFQSILRDITELKMAEESIKEAELKFRTIFNSASDGILLAQADKRDFVEANEKICDMLGYTNEELLKLSVPDIHPEESMTYVLDQFEKLTRGEKWIARDIPLLKKDNSVLFTDVTASPITFKGKECLIGMFRDARERRKAEEELRESRESYRRLFEDHSAAKLIIDPDTGIILDANKAAVNYYGWTREQMQQMNISDINMLTPEGVKSELEKVKHHKKVQFEFRHRLADDSIRNIEVYSSTIEMNGKEVLHSIVHDITERKRAEDSLRQSEEKYRSIIENMQEGYFESDLNGYFTFFNDITCQHFGYSREELLRLNMNQYTDKEISKEFIHNLVNLYKTGEPLRDLRWQIIRKDGLRREVEGSMFLRNDPSGKPIGFKGIVRDITERKKSEEALIIANQQLENIIEFLPDATMISDKDNKIIAWNRAMEQMTGISKTEMIGQDHHQITIPFYGERRTFLMDLVSIPDNELEEKYSNVKRIGKIIYAETFTPMLYDKKGAYVFAAAGPLFDSNGNIVGMIESIRDVTERKKAENEIIKLNASLEQRIQERTAELEAFSYSVSHDLRAPLRTIEGFGLALLEDYENKLDTQAKDYLDRIRNATGTMAELIEDMLKLFRITRTEMDLIQVNLSNIAESITGELKKSQPQRQVNIIIAKSMEDSADPRLIRIVLENLMGNAWKFTEKKTNAEIEFGLTKKHLKNVYFVRDNGAGFDMEYAHKLFAPFQRLHNVDEYPGTGIGLAIIKRIISRHGGTVWAEGTLGQGATFYFTLQ